MAQTIQLKATARGGVGKGAARAVRRADRVPGIIYGDKQSATPISVDLKELTLQFHKGGFLSTVVEVDLDGKKERVIPRAVQLDPVRDFPVHVDFQRLGKGAAIRVAVPVRFVNHDKSPGLKRGGVLNIVRREIEIYCPSETIPDVITIDIGELDIGGSLHISAVALPPGVKTVIQSRDFTIATIAAAKAEEEVKPATAVAAEGAAAAPAEGAAKADDKASADKGGDKPAKK